jgi:hypothetical protein
MTTISVTLNPSNKEHKLILRYLEERQSMYNYIDEVHEVPEAEGFTLEDTLYEELLMLADCYYNEDEEE